MRTNSGGLVVERVGVSYGSLVVLDDASIAVPPGMVVGLVGPNGAGKTTLVDVASGFIRPLQGRVLWDGRPITDLAPHRRARLGLGRTFQHLGLASDLSCLDHLCTGAAMPQPYRVLDPLTAPWRWRRGEADLRARGEQLLGDLGVAACAHVATEEVPFGSARFVEVASVLARQPSILLLDEPTTGLSRAEIVGLVEVLKEVRASGTGMLVVSHDPSFIDALCHRVYTLDHGRIVEADDGQSHHPATETNR
ncbi:MAG TPA: ATP-binding cassette domain-containing protein [Acidimicrobiales bacterium]|nr:ATP-binding cassette domain-containing protein [Acidimicrobiales bacterium]